MSPLSKQLLEIVELLPKKQLFLIFELCPILVLNCKTLKFPITDP